MSDRYHKHPSSPANPSLGHHKYDVNTRIPYRAATGMASTKEDDTATITTWLDRCVQLTASTTHVTVALMTAADFSESWELPLAVCLSSTNDFKLLGCGANELRNGVSLEHAVEHLWNASCSEEGLYLWPGDQSQGFEGYPTESPLAGPFSRLRLAAVLERLGEFLRLAETTAE